MFTGLPAWARLSRQTREFFAAKIPNNLQVPTSIADSACVAELRSAGFIMGESPRLRPSLRPFRRAIRAMHRHRVFDGSDDGMQGYIEDHLTRVEAVSLLDHHRSCHESHWRHAEALASDEGWIRSFLDAERAAEWEKHRPNYVRDTWLGKVEVAEQLKRWVMQCVEGENPIPLSVLAADHEKDPEVTSDALTAAVRYLLLFPALRSETLEPVIGIWPEVHRRMNRVSAKPPATDAHPPPDAAVFSTPFLLDSMTTVLVNTFPDGLRIRRSGAGLFKRELDRLAVLLAPLPQNLGLSTDGAHRIHEACYWLEALSLGRVKGKDGKHPVLVATKQGKEWLAGSVQARLKAMVGALRKAYDQRTSRYARWGAHLCFVSRELDSGGWGYDKELDPQRRLTEAFTGYEVGQWISLKAFLDWQAETANPLLHHAGRTSFRYGRFLHASVPEKEAHWRAYVDDFITRRLLPLGGVQVSVDASGDTSFALTSAGACLLGRTETLEYSAPETAGHVLVQPNFEVVFTAAAPGLESEFAQLAERVGHGVGTLFRITRQAILAALDAGIEGDEVLVRLGDLTHKPIPTNVVAQIKGWTSSYRRVAVRRMLTIRCPDHETALHVQAIFPRLVRPVTDTLLEVTNPKSLSAIKTKLKQNGIGIE